MGVVVRWCFQRTTDCGESCSRNGSGRWESEMTLAAVQHILPLTTIIRQRVLPVKGTVRARLNQKVTSGDIVAEAVWARDHIFLDVARTFGITGEAADKRMRCKPGDTLQAGAVVAVGRGLV